MIGRLTIIASFSLRNETPRENVSLDESYAQALNAYTVYCMSAHRRHRYD